MSTFQTTFLKASEIRKVAEYQSEPDYSSLINHLFWEIYQAAKKKQFHIIHPSPIPNEVVIKLIDQGYAIHEYGDRCKIAW